MRSRARSRCRLGLVPAIIQADRVSFLDAGLNRAERLLKDKENELHKVGDAVTL